MNDSDASPRSSQPETVLPGVAPSVVGASAILETHDTEHRDDAMPYEGLMAVPGRAEGGMSSWEFFDKLLGECHVVGTPGSGFGPAGEGFFRLSAFGHRENVEKAVSSITENLAI